MAKKTNRREFVKAAGLTRQRGRIISTFGLDGDACWKMLLNAVPSVQYVLSEAGGDTPGDGRGPRTAPWRAARSENQSAAASDYG